MIAHVVLFRPKEPLAASDRDRLLAALVTAFDQITTITRARVGRRVTLGRAYDAGNAQDFPFTAILEFDDTAGLQAYLDHPAHQALGEQFYLTSEAALVFDYELYDKDHLQVLFDSH